MKINLRFYLWRNCELKFVLDSLNQLEYIINWQEEPKRKEKWKCFLGSAREVFHFDERAATVGRVRNNHGLGAEHTSPCAAPSRNENGLCFLAHVLPSAAWAGLFFLKFKIELTFCFLAGRKCGGIVNWKLCLTPMLHYGIIIVDGDRAQQQQVRSTKAVRSPAVTKASLAH